MVVIVVTKVMVVCSDGYHGGDNGDKGDGGDKDDGGL